MPRVNPILAKTAAPEADVNAIRAAALARTRTARRDILDLRRKEAAAAVLARLTRDNEVFALTLGQFSLIDLFAALLDVTGPARVSLSTWTAAHVDLSRVLDFLADGRVLSTRWLLDLSFTRRQPQIAARIRERFGQDAVRVTKNHAKFFTLTTEGADPWRIVCRTSMNLNHNARLEDLTIAHDPALWRFLETAFDDLWQRRGPRGTRGGADQAP